MKVNTAHVEAVETSLATEQIVENQSYDAAASTTPACVDILYLNSVTFIPFYDKLHLSCRNILQNDKDQMCKWCYDPNKIKKVICVLL